MKPKRSVVLKLKQLFKGKFLLSFALLVAVGAGIYNMFFTSLFHIRSVVVTTVYKDINAENLQGAIGEMALNKHLFLISLTEVSTKIYDSFPDVSAIVCARNLIGRRLECDAIGYELVAVIQHQNERYYINENGVVITFDSRKLGLPFFDLILNPVFAEIEDPPKEAAQPLPEQVLQPVLPVNLPPESLTASILGGRESGDVSALTPSIIPDLDIPDTSLFFIQPDQAPPVEPLILHVERRVFNVSVGQKILDPDELQTILKAIHELEQVLGRKVIEAQYVQVAGELSLKSKPSVGVQEGAEGLDGTDPATSLGAGGTEEGVEASVSDEDPEHEIIILLDLRRDLEDQLRKLSKTKEVIDFSEVSQIDLSIDGEKVFYR